MADEVDKTTEREEYILALNIAHSAKPVPTGNANGRCWTCDAEVEQGRRWCDAQCRDEYEL